MRKISEALASLGAEPQYMVNNAGFGLAGRAAKLDRAEQLAMIDLNVRALTDLSLAFVDSLARHKGGVLNVGSVAGFLPGPGMAVYYATKAYRAVVQRGAAQRVQGAAASGSTVLCPGPVATEFAERAGVAGHMAPVDSLADAEPGRRAGLPRLDARPTRGRRRARQQAGIAAFMIRLVPQPAAAGGGRQPAITAQIRAKAHSRYRPLMLQSAAKPLLLSERRDEAPQ